MADPSAIPDVVAALAGLGGAGLGYVFKYWSDRRNNSGQIETSSADVIWQQSQNLHDMLMKQNENERADKERAEKQRDRLIESQAGHVVPALTALNQSMDSIYEMMKKVLKAVEGANHESS